MTPEMEALGRRAIACKGWRWMPGMLGAIHGDVTRITRLVDYAMEGGDGCDEGRLPGAPLEELRGVEGVAAEYPQCVDGYILCNEEIPDFGDAATRGVLLELVREAWKDPELYAFQEHIDGRHWKTMRPYYGMQEGEPTEAGALVLALEEAP